MGILTFVSILLGVYFYWTPGLASLFSLTIPVIVIASLSNRTERHTITWLSCVFCLVESMVTAGSNFSTDTFILPLASVFIYHVISYLASEPNLSFRLRKYSENTLPQLNHETNGRHPRNHLKIATHSESILADPNTSGHLLDYPLLLQKLQDIISQVTHELNLEELLPTLETTAKDALDARQCHLFLWDAESWNFCRHHHAGKTVPLPSSRQGMSAWVLTHRQILIKQRIEREPDLANQVYGELEDYDATVPLIAHEEMIGILFIRGGDVTSLNYLRMLHIISNMFALAVKNAQLFYHIEQMARKDGLTGLLNHVTFLQELDLLIADAIKHDYPLTLFMGDIDFFKKFNDTYGHQVGDQVLKEVAGIWKDLAPTDALLGRYGGEEFICALPHTHIQEAFQVAENIRRRIESTPVRFKQKNLQVTISAGVAELHKPASNSHELIYLADEFLYSAKNAGRNQVVIGSGVTHLH
ncbi:Response regulator PleD [Polystyrenella longa]|uniref:diguanylate cyclase n=1 Tax=Polystyrenella longa TaxID=2528007 RepID=A0A518CSF0_9PLAN|nr:sensor domain-containing diguanylate cyclase [Polystyrenella longa]QDU82151.1 Response regulator PleD [Polystyrenella longa]